MPTTGGGAILGGSTIGVEGGGALGAALTDEGGVLDIGGGATGLLTDGRDGDDAEK